ncbi:MAG: methionine--tRNA ligase subunit beta, partial [Armatimonadetes bacterium]|nr:methionine--tRNA ligase subunit beta [Candidatus Hippobium faecium]
LGLEMPKHLIGHGFWTIDGEKISKSKGNAINPAKVAEDLAAESGAKVNICKDVVRYYLCRETSFGMDADFSFENFRGRYNSDLSNDLGNILNRTLGMLNSYNEGKVPDSEGGELDDIIKSACDTVLESMDKFAPNLALDAIWGLISTGNKYINDKAPWILVKEGKTEELYRVLVSALEVCRAVAVLVEPFMPNVAREIARQLNISIDVKWEDIIKKDAFKGVETNAPEPIFPRMNLKKQNGQKKEKKVEEAKEVKQEPVEEKKEEYISIDDFAKVDLRVATIIEAEKLEGTDKILKLKMDVGDHTRTICAGMAPYYDPEYMVGKQVIIVANLKPRKMRGVVSEGMMLAGGEEIVKFLSPEAPLPNGSKIR